MDNGLVNNSNSFKAAPGQGAQRIVAANEANEANLFQSSESLEMLSGCIGAGQLAANPHGKGQVTIASVQFHVMIWQCCWRLLEWCGIMDNDE
jgi:hypothetical protein